MRRFIRLFFFFALGMLSAELFCGNTLADTTGQYVEDLTCAECHEAKVETFKKSLHGRVFGEKNGIGYGCESCHGSGEKHIIDQSATSIVSFGKTATAQKGAGENACLRCHSASDELAQWDMGRHSRTDISCTDCHSVHSDQKLHANRSDSCLECHANVRSKIRKLSHHPIEEKKVSCSDCHNSHGTMTKAMLRADSKNELCYSCHAEKRGPFMWEHVPVEEDCTTCHNPHGSNTTALLETRVSTLCQNCHNSVMHRSQPYDKGSSFGSTRSDPGSRLLVGRSCLNCHANIHGSVHPSGQYLTR